MNSAQQYLINDERNSKKNQIICNWCIKYGSELYSTVDQDKKSRIFCSEVCFFNWRRSLFKRNLFCDNCKKEILSKSSLITIHGNKQKNQYFQLCSYLCYLKLQEINNLNNSKINTSNEHQTTTTQTNFKLINSTPTATTTTTIEQTNISKRTQIYNKNDTTNKRFCSNNINRNSHLHSVSNQTQPIDNDDNDNDNNNNCKTDINNVMLFWYNYMNSFLTNHETAINTN